MKQRINNFFKKHIFHIWHYQGKMSYRGGREKGGEMTKMWQCKIAKCKKMKYQKRSITPAEYTGWLSN